MAHRPSSKSRLALLGDVLKLLRQRRRPVQSLLIHPDGTVEIRLGKPFEIVGEPEPEDEIARWLREHDVD